MLYARFRKFLNRTRTRILILVLLIVIPTLAAQVLGAWNDLQQSISDRKLESVRVIQHAQSDFNNMLAETRTVFSNLVRLNEMRNPNNCTYIFTNLRFAFERLAPDAVNMGLADAQGNIFCAINPVKGSTNISDQPDFQAAVNTLDMAAGVYRLNPNSRTPSVSISYPVLSFNGEVQTVIFAIFELHWLNNWEDESALPPGYAMTLLAPDQSTLWRTVDGKVEAVESIGAASAPWFRTLQGGDKVVETQDFDGVSRLHTTISLLNTATLHLGYPVKELYSKTYANLYLKLILLGLVGVFVLGLAWWESETLFLRPLDLLMGVVKRVQGGDLKARTVALKSLVELNELARSFDQMTEALQKREAEQRRLEERFRAAFESSAIGMGLLTLDGRILAANEAVCRMSGYTEEELKQRNDRENTYPEDVDVGMDLFAELMGGKRGYYNIEKRYMRKNGKVFWTRLTLSLVRNDEGEPSYLIGMVEDIDEAKRMQGDLQKSEARFRAMYEHSAVGMGLMGLDRTLLDVNPALCKIFDRPREELLGQTSALVTHPDDLPRAIQYHQDLMAGKFDHYFDERRYIRKNGEIFWASISMSLVRDENGKPLYLIGMVNDINEAKKSQDILRESETRFKAMYDNAAVGMAMMTLDRRIISVNQASTRMTGYSIEELVNTDPGRLSHPDDLMIGMDQYREMVAGRLSGFQMVKRFIRKDGKMFWGRVTYSIVPKLDGSPEYLVGLIEDISEQKNSAERLAAQEAEYRQTLEERIAERTQELNQANQRLQEKATQDAVLAERTRLARDLHDAVTQTLFSTTLIADVLPDIWEMNQAEGKRRLEELRVLTRGALAEMRTLLVELRPNALVEVPLPTLLRQLVDALIGRARINIQLSTEGETKLPADVQIGLYRIAQEALNNVIKHAKASEAVVTLRLGETVRLTVADNGKGFESSTVTADHLGLKIMRERAEAIGAKINIYSEPDEGTQISVVWQERKDTK